MLPNGMDLGVLVIVGIFVLLGWKQGLVKMGLRLLSFVVAFGCAWALYPYVAELLKKTPWYQSVLDSMGVSSEPIAKATEVSAWGFAAGEYVADLLMNGVAFLLLLVLARVALFFLAKVLNFVASLPILGFFNRLGGMAAGFLEGLLVVWILCAAIAVVPSLRENKEIEYAMEQSLIARNFYQDNFVVQALMPEENSKADEN